MSYSGWDVFNLVESGESQEFVQRPRINGKLDRLAFGGNSTGQRVHGCLVLLYEARINQRPVDRIIEHHRASRGQRSDKSQRFECRLRAAIRRDAEPGKEADFAWLESLGRKRRTKALRLFRSMADLEDAQICISIVRTVVRAAAQDHVLRRAARNRGVQLFAGNFTRVWFHGIPRPRLRGCHNGCASPP